jgi:hypothetical protein
VSTGETSRSMESALHDLGAIEDPMPSSERFSLSGLNLSECGTEPPELRETRWLVGQHRGVRSYQEELCVQGADAWADAWVVKA